MPVVRLTLVIVGSHLVLVYELVVHVLSRVGVVLLHNVLAEGWDLVSVLHHVLLRDLLEVDIGVRLVETPLVHVVHRDVGNAVKERDKVVGLCHVVYFMFERKGLPPWLDVYWFALDIRLL